VRAYREIRQATDEELAAMRDRLSALMDYERFLGSDLLTGLCTVNEALAAEQGRRASGGIVVPGGVRR
jgi:hypothetical protein